MAGQQLEWEWHRNVLPCFHVLERPPGTPKSSQRLHVLHLAEGGQGDPDTLVEAHCLQVHAGCLSVDQEIVDSSIGDANAGGLCRYREAIRYMDLVRVFEYET